MTHIFFVDRYSGLWLSTTGYCFPCEQRNTQVEVVARHGTVPTYGVHVCTHSTAVVGVKCRRPPIERLGADMDKVRMSASSSSCCRSVRVRSVWQTNPAGCRGILARIVASLTSDTRSQSESVVRPLARSTKMRGRFPVPMHRRTSLA